MYLDGEHLGRYDNDFQYASFSDLVGKRFHTVEKIVDSDEKIVFRSDTETYVMWHEQDCCESVNIDDICGDLDDLVRILICI